MPTASSRDLKNKNGSVSTKKKGGRGIINFGSGEGMAPRGLRTGFEGNKIR